jgi:hypothetical protein
MFTSPCARCPRVFTFPAETPHSQIDRAMEIHCNVCPRTIRYVLEVLSRLESSALTMPQCRNEEPLWIDDHTPTASTSHIVSEPIAYTQVVFAIPVNNLTAITNTEDEIESAKESVGRHCARGRTNMTEDQRRRLLEEDEWTARVEPRRVTCGACGLTILLDQRPGQYGRRGRYYPGPWMKHRRRCQEIERLEALATEVMFDLSRVHR